MFDGFDPEKVARFTDARLDRIAADPAIVRHRPKVESVRKNARVVLALQESGQYFTDVVWEHVDHQPVDNAFVSLQQVPSSTATSVALSRRLKSLGFSFVGPTTCYAFMQAAGLVNDHLVGCPRHAELS